MTRALAWVIFPKGKHKLCQCRDASTWHSVVDTRSTSTNTPVPLEIEQIGSVRLLEEPCFEITVWQSENHVHDRAAPAFNRTTVIPFTAVDHRIQQQLQGADRAQGRRRDAGIRRTGALVEEQWQRTGCPDFRRPVAAGNGRRSDDVGLSSLSQPAHRTVLES